MTVSRATLFAILGLWLLSVRVYFSRSLLRGVARLIFLVFIVPVQDKIGSHAGQKAVDQASHLPASDHFRVDEVTVQVEDQISDHGSIHTLLNVAGESDFVDAKLTRHVLNLIFEAELCRFVLDAKIYWDNHGTGWQRRERLDAPLRLHVDAAVVVKERV